MMVFQIPIAALAAIILSAFPGQGAEKKPIEFSGQVESVDLQLHTVAIRHGVIPGYLPALTTDYMVDDDAVLKQLKPSDRIQAIVYVGDPTLHHIRVQQRSSNGVSGTR